WGRKGPFRTTRRRCCRRSTGPVRGAPVMRGWRPSQHPLNLAGDHLQRRTTVREQWPLKVLRGASLTERLVPHNRVDRVAATGWGLRVVVHRRLEPDTVDVRPGRVNQCRGLLRGCLVRRLKDQVRGLLEALTRRALERGLCELAPPLETDAHASLTSAYPGNRG